MHTGLELCVFTTSVFVPSRAQESTEYFTEAQRIGSIKDFFSSN